VEIIVRVFGRESWVGGSGRGEEGGECVHRDTTKGKRSRDKEKMLQPRREPIHQPLVIILVLLLLLSCLA